MNFNNLNGYTVEDTAARTAIGSIEEDGTINNISSKFGDNSTIVSALNQCLTEENFTNSFTNKLGANNGIATLDPNGKIPASQLTVEAMEYKGKFDASNGTLPTGGFSIGDFYIISVAGTISSIGTLKQNDKIIYNGSGWDWLPAGGVSSVNNKTGDVSLTLDDIPAGTNTMVPSKENIVDLIYPIGSVYISTKPATGNNSLNPETIFPGTHWQQISQGRVLLGAGSGNDGTDSMSFTTGSSGGKYKHKLTTPEMPSHYHSIDHQHNFDPVYNSKGAVINNLWFYAGESRYTSINKSTNTEHGCERHELSIKNYTGNSGNKGEDKPHNNIQPYLAVTIWERTT